MTGKLCILFHTLWLKLTRRYQPLTEHYISITIFSENRSILQLWRFKLETGSWQEHADSYYSLSNVNLSIATIFKNFAVFLFLFFVFYFFFIHLYVHSFVDFFLIILTLFLIIFYFQIFALYLCLYNFACYTFLFPL